MVRPISGIEIYLKEFIIINSSTINPSIVSKLLFACAKSETVFVFFVVVYLYVYVFVCPYVCLYVCFFVLMCMFCIIICVFLYFYVCVCAYY